MTATDETVAVLRALHDDLTALHDRYEATEAHTIAVHPSWLAGKTSGIADAMHVVQEAIAAAEAES